MKILNRPQDHPSRSLLPAARRPGAPPGSRAAARPWATAAAVAAGTALVGWRAAGLGQWIVDDAAVTFAYVRSVGDGLGPVQQAGAGPVEGYSNPAWLALLLVGRALGLFDHGAWFGVADLALFPKALALVCVAGTLACVGGIARVALPERAWLVVLGTGGLLAASYAYVVWCFSGLENSLYGLAAAALALLLVRRGAGTGPACAAAGLALLAALTRPDGAVLAAAYPAVALLLRRRAAVRDVLVHCAVFAAGYGGFLLWRHATFGLWVPNTAVAKAQQAPDTAEFAKVGELIGYAGWALVLVCAGCAGLVLARPGPVRRAAGVLCVPLALSLFAYGALAPDWMPLYRFATPVWVLGSAVAALTVTAAWRSARVRGRVLLGCALGGALTLSLAGQGVRDEQFRAEPTLSMCWVAERYGRTFTAYADRLALRPGATVVLPDLGGTLLTSRLRVVDLAGLTDRRIASAYASGDRAGVRGYVLDEVRPALLHAHAAWVGRTGLTPARLAAAGYVPLYREENGGDFVLASAVPGGAERIAAVRAWAKPRIDRMRHLKHAERGYLGGCGSRLVPGSSVAGPAVAPVGAGRAVPRAPEMQALRAASHRGKAARSACLPGARGRIDQRLRRGARPATTQPAPANAPQLGTRPAPPGTAHPIPLAPLRSAPVTLAEARR
ncbi:hypothetical protein [Streptomyces sp. NPDC052225]|uniref:hypothetical protein n=1 Tax=Streptomyces sp. NPDC052225 TaxID=3154949 RepID=UPI00341A29FD